MASFKILELKDKLVWNWYLSQLPVTSQDIYYTPEYYKLYEDYGDGKALCFVYHDDCKILIYPFLKNNINILGYVLDHEYFDIQGAYGYNGVITNSYDQIFIDSFYRTFHEYCIKENIIAEFTRFSPILKNYEVSIGNMEVRFDRKTVLLNIEKSEDEIWSNSYTSTNRNMIRKALKNNIQICESTNLDDYIEFYNIYVETMNNVGSEEYYYFNQFYFQNFIKYLPSNHILILAKFNGEIIGGMILMMYMDYAHYHLSCRKADFGQFALNNLFLDYAIKAAKLNKCKLFHFGGGTTSDDKDSLLKFKSNFSKEKGEFFIGKKVHNAPVYNMVIQLWEKSNEHKKDRFKNVLLKYRM